MLIAQVFLLSHKTIANDKNLTILSTERKLSYFLEEVENFRDGKQSPPQKISQWTLNELRANPFDRQLLLDVGKEAGLIPVDRSVFRGNERNQVIDYLDKYYFGWNTLTFNYDNPKNDAQAVEEDFER